MDYTSSTPMALTLKREIRSLPLSTEETDCFFAVASTTSERYYAAGFTTIGDDTHMAVARFGSTGDLDTSFGSSGIATVNVAVGAVKQWNS
jgi:hypothetical protein